MEYSYKFRLYPNKEQIEQIERTFGCCRFVYNYYLALRKEQYEKRVKVYNYNACSADMTKLKKNLQWLSDVDATALQSSLRALDDAYQKFFRGIKTHKRKVGYPHFKSKHNVYQSYKSKCVKDTDNIRVVDDKHVRIPKLNIVRCAVSREVKGRILSATISRVPSGKYFVALCCTDVELPQEPPTGAVIGIDIGIKDLAITSDGKKYPNAKNYTNNQKKLARLQRQLSRKTKGSRNRKKAQHKVALLHEHIANQRNDAIHKMTSDLVSQYDVICMEGLNTKGMLKNHHLAKAVADASFGEIRRQLEYKAAWHGKKISMIDRFFPSSQLCNCCGYRNPETKDLSIRYWVCPSCGAHHDRDINAANNILTEGMRILSVV